MTDQMNFIDPSCADDMAKHYKTLKEQVCIEDDVIVIRVANEYSIELSRCDTYEKILSWVLHLSEKTWMTMDVLRYFIQVAMQHHKLEYPAT